MNPEIARVIGFTLFGLAITIVGIVMIELAFREATKNE